MAAAGWAEPWIAAAAMTVCYLAAIGFVAVWRDDMAILATSLRQIAADAAAHGPHQAATLRSTQQLQREIERVARRVAAHDVLVDQLRRADERSGR